MAKRTITIEDAVKASFDIVEPTGHDYFLALDISSSMTWNAINNIWLKPFQIAGIMALATVKAEKNYFVGGFSDNFIQLRITKNTSYNQVSNENSAIWNQSFGGTNAGAAYEYALNKKAQADVFVFYTDSESWGGTQPSQLLKRYRNQFNKNAKAIYITLVPYGDHITLADPKDPQSYDIAGFTASTPKLISMIAQGNI